MAYEFITAVTVMVLALLAQAFFMVIAGPYLSHATMRAIRVREKGDWRSKTASWPEMANTAPREEREQ